MGLSYKLGNGEHPIRLPNGLMYPGVELEQRSHSGDEIVAFDYES